MSPVARAPLSQREAVCRLHKEFHLPLDIRCLSCYNKSTQKNNTDRPTSVGNRACRATAPLGDKETRCKSVATAIAVIRRFCLSVGMLIGLCLTKNSWATGERDRAEWIRQGIPFRHGCAPLGGCFCFILYVILNMKGKKKNETTNQIRAGTSVVPCKPCLPCRLL